MAAGRHVGAGHRVHAYRHLGHGGWAVVALVLFRFFDIVKPLGIRNLDRRKGAFWVMGDDILGGIYALIVLIICKLLYTWLA